MWSLLVHDPFGHIVVVLFAQHLSSRGSSCLGSLLGAVLSLLSRSVGLLIGLVGAINGDLDGDFTSLNLLAVHLSNGLLLQLLRGQGDESEATSLAGLTAGLELLDHEAGNGTQGDLGGRRLIGVEELLELKARSFKSAKPITAANILLSYLLLGQVVGQVSHHDLSLGGNAIGRRATFASLAGGASLILGLSSRVSVVGLVGNVLQRLNLVGCCGIGGGRSGAVSAFLLLILHDMVSSKYLHSRSEPEVWPYLTGTARTATPGAVATTAAPGRLAATVALTLSVGIGLLGVGLGLASKLDGDLALKDLLARELGNGTLRLGGGGQVDEGVADGAFGSWVLGDGDSLAGDPGRLAGHVLEAWEASSGRCGSWRARNTSTCIIWVDAGAARNKGTYVVMVGKLSQLWVSGTAGGGWGGQAHV